MGGRSTKSRNDHVAELMDTGFEVQRRRGHGFGAGDGEPGRDARALVDRGRLAQGPGVAGENLEQGVRNLGNQGGFLANHGDLVGEFDDRLRPQRPVEVVVQRHREIGGRQQRADGLVDVRKQRNQVFCRLRGLRDGIDGRLQRFGVLALDRKAHV